MQKTVNLQIPVPADWRDSLHAAASKRGETLAEFVRAAIVDRLSAKERKGLSDPPKMGRPPKPKGEQ